MDFHAFMYVTIGRRHELERGMAGKDPVLYQRMLDDIAEYARTCDQTGWAGIGNPSFTLVLHGAPFQEAESPSYHWHVEITPLLLHADPAWSHGLPVNAVPPEDAARFLRDTPE